MIVGREWEPPFRGSGRQWGSKLQLAQGGWSRSSPDDQHDGDHGHPCHCHQQGHGHHQIILITFIMTMLMLSKNLRRGFPSSPHWAIAIPVTTANTTNPKMFVELRKEGVLGRLRDEKWEKNIKMGEKLRRRMAKDKKWEKGNTRMFLELEKCGSIRRKRGKDWILEEIK